MFPPVIRPCFRGKALSRLGAGATLTTLVLYICMSIQSKPTYFSDGTQYVASNHRKVRETRMNTIEGNTEDSLLVDFRKLSEEFVVRNQTVAKGSLIAYFKYRLQRTDVAMKVGLALYREEVSQFACEDSAAARADSAQLGTTVIYSLLGVDSVADAILFLRNNFKQLPANSVGDVIVTVEEEADADYKDKIENLIDLCTICRLFFFTGSIWEHRIKASRFAHGEILVFVDARVQPITDAWLWPLVNTILHDSRLVASPQLRLRGGDHGLDFSMGVTRNEITWGMNVARGGVGPREIYNVIKSNRSSYSSNNNAAQHELMLEQTAISKEVFSIRKTFLKHLGGFEMAKDYTGGEHVLFSLKVLNCGGNIAMCFCSTMVLEIPGVSNFKHPFDDSARSWPSPEDLVRQNAETVDFQSPSFDVPTYSSGHHLTYAKDIWLDPYSRKYSACVKYTTSNTSVRRRYAPVTSNVQNRSNRMDRFGYNTRRAERAEPNMTVKIRQQINKLKCPSRNFRVLIAKRQPTMISPTKLATFYGYIRSLDGLYAFGVSPAKSAQEIYTFATRQSSVYVAGQGVREKTPLKVAQNVSSNSGIQNFDREHGFHIVLTRNSSEWIGPFSHTNGAFVYQHSLCLTLTSSGLLTLKKCVKGTRSQLFVYTAQMIKPVGVVDQWACAKLSNSHDGEATTAVSAPVFVSSCVKSDHSAMFLKFKMDVSFRDKCVT
ncbi:polypeptide n-acetylgalactosaminyltransferase [Plakobranchus ocellatus]|uniref:Polypeptide n-acetylgalactosaminyltransferase n=1 Tax=Plakobranchus ocellatus TaxID=259542 RepID=A0AAV4BTG6_9GAST|nr:polypeptide n-acetylgalactosaminyltransferase [Plakobranchus ocellatus]